MGDLRAPGLTDLVTPVVVRAAATLGLFEEVGQAPAPMDALPRLLGVDPDIVHRLVRFLVVRDVLTVDASETVRLTVLGRALTGTYATRLNWSGAAGHLDRMFVARCHAALRGEPADRDLWADFDRDVELAESFDDLMWARADEWAGPVVEHGIWRDVRRVADLGGGRGHLLFRLLAAWPHLHGMLVERAGPARAAMHEVQQLGLRDRTEVIVADLREAIPSGCDVYLLAHVLHDWDDEAAVEILRRAADAAGRDGRVVVVERELAEPSCGDRDAQLEATAQDLRLLVLFGGRERSLDDFRELAGRAGLALHQRSPLPRGRSLLAFD